MENEKKLKSGFTTGAAAAAAVKAALVSILDEECPKMVAVKLLTGDEISIAVHDCRSESDNCAICTVIKDAGDDPDITHKAEIGAKVTLFQGRNSDNDPVNHLVIKGGKGVGRVTKPGLEIEPGEAAINTGPLRMIRNVVASLEDKYAVKLPVEIEIFVPEGERLAKKTLNGRLGIVGGISILGTTGVVRPMSHAAYKATIRSSISVAVACGLNETVFTTGRRSERFAQDLYPGLSEEAFIQIGDFFGFSLNAAKALGVFHIILTVFFGKAVKMACGVPHTHAAKSRLSLEQLALWTGEVTANRETEQRVGSANTAREAFFMLKDDYPEVIRHVGRLMIASAGKLLTSDTDNGEPPAGVKVDAVIFDFDGNVCFNSQT